MKTLSPAITERKNQLENLQPWLVLYEVTVNDAGDVLRLVNYHDPITFAGDVYQPFPITHGERTEDSEGTLPTLDVTVGNVTREIQQLVEANAGLIGRKVRILVVSALDLAEPTPAMEMAFHVRGATTTPTQATFRLAHINPQNQPFPSERFIRSRCRWTYKSPECGYTGALPDCDKTLLGTNGCTVHGDDEETNGLPRLHPKRFGGFPGIRKGAA